MTWMICFVTFCHRSICSQYWHILDRTNSVIASVESEVMSAPFQHIDPMMNRNHLWMINRLNCDKKQIGENQRTWWPHLKLGLFVRHDVLVVVSFVVIECSAWSVIIIDHRQLSSIESDISLFWSRSERLASYGSCINYFFVSLIWIASIINKSMRDE